MANLYPIASSVSTTWVGWNPYSPDCFCESGYLGQLKNVKHDATLSLTVSSLYLTPTVAIVSSDKSIYTSPSIAKDFCLTWSSLIKPWIGVGAV